jgi:hypothetical protein
MNLINSEINWRSSLLWLFAALQIFSSSCCTGDKEKSKEQDSARKSELTNLVYSWNNAHVSKNIGEFLNLYNGVVKYYGTDLDRNSCIVNKMEFFKKNPDYSQQVSGEIQIEFLNDNEVKCSFLKKVTLRGRNLEFPSYLVFKEVEGKWLIVQESDLVTDGNLSRNKTSENIPNDAVSGDFNGDGKAEFMWLVTPKLIENDMSCEGNCTSVIQFSDNNIPSIKVEDCIDGLPVNEGDLNNNGTDEIGLLPGWFTSCWHSYLVWTIKNGSWVYAVDPISTHCNQWDEGVDAIEKDRKKEGYVIVRYSEITDADFVVLSKSVRIIR